MPCPKAKRGSDRVLINQLLAHPATRAARASKRLRRHLDDHGWVTPNFAWSELDDTGGATVPSGLRPNTIRHCWNLELFARKLGRRRHRGRGKRVSITIDGPYRTPQHNAAIGGASQSRHMSADATDHFSAQVLRWMNETGLARNEIIGIAQTCFTAVGNENSGTFHFDSRPGAKGSVNFITW